jgi:hypothetical protein
LKFKEYSLWLLVGGIEGGIEGREQRGYREDTGRIE